jgi:predicted metal-dependent phosphoesterase TrpH
LIDMWTELVDLHSHSTFSDGAQSVAEMAKRASENGVKVWSLTDHDTDAGWQQAMTAAENHGMRFIPGVEITCAMAIAADPEVLAKNETTQPHSWHLLAYFPTGGSEELSEWLAEQKDARLPRMKAMLAKLAEHGHEISIEEVSKYAEGSLGRPHLAQVMIEKGIVESFQEAFDQWIGDDGPAFAPRPLPSIEEAVEIVKRSNGITSLAHPVYYGIATSELVEYLQGVGVDAIEAFHRSHTSSYRLELMSSGMDVTVGGDSHGTEHNPSPGKMVVPLKLLHPLLRPE